VYSRTCTARNAIPYRCGRDSESSSSQGRRQKLTKGCSYFFPFPLPPSFPSSSLPVPFSPLSLASLSLKFCFKTCVAMKFVDDDDDDDDDPFPSIPPVPCPSLPLPLPPISSFPAPFPPLRLEVGPLNQLGGLGSAVSSPSEVRGEFGAL